MRKFISDFSGTGAKLYGGRWNSEGLPMLYTSATASLALLEFICNSNNLSFSKGVALAEIILPPATKFKKVTLNELPYAWNTYPAPLELKLIGDNWLRENKTLALKVPSAVMASEMNVLINPSHPDFHSIQFVISDQFNFDNRLMKN